MWSSDAFSSGTLTLEDLASYNATVTDAWDFHLGEYQMYIPPPPAGGIILSLILNILKGYGLKSESLTGQQKILAYHRYAEAFKFVSGLKKHIRDPNFMFLNALYFSQMVRKFIEDSFADHIRSLISSDKARDPQHYNISSYLESMGTSHVSVLAEDGSAVSVTSTINHIFGSGVFSPRTGVILNNELCDFCGRVDDIYPGNQINMTFCFCPSAFVVLAGEQPPSSMAPAVLKSQSKMLVIGSSGGDMITTGIASTLMNHLWFGKSLKDAIDTPVIYSPLLFSLQNVIAALKYMRHNRTAAEDFYNVVNAVEKEDGCICAVSDARKEGQASGY
uniref:Gamma-glutamyltransferase 5a n=1 Tax=Lates calcarifer TaxID=8187 RepID=A0A4W6F305_LATCA